MGRLLQLIPNRLHIRKELIDRLSGRLFHIDKKTPKLILVREASSGNNDDSEDPKQPWHFHSNQSADEWKI